MGHKYNGHAATENQKELSPNSKKEQALLPLAFAHYCKRIQAWFRCELRLNRKVYHPLPQQPANFFCNFTFMQCINCPQCHIIIIAENSLNA